MPIGSSVLPVATTCSQVQSVPESFKLGNAMQLAFVNQGDGFFDFRGTMVVGGVPRLIRELNGEVIAGTGMAVRIRDTGQAIMTNVSAGEPGTTEIEESMKEAIKQMKDAVQRGYVVCFADSILFLWHNVRTQPPSARRGTR